MSEFRLFVSNLSKKIEKAIQNQDIKSLSEELPKLYKVGLSAFPSDVETIFKKYNVDSVFEYVSIAVNVHILDKINSFETDINKIILNINGTKKEFPIVNIVPITEKLMNIKKTDEYFYLILSYLSIPVNFEKMQLFLIYFAIKNGKASLN